MIHLNHSQSQNIQFKDAFNTALEKAKKGMESTKDIVSNKGRSKRLGHRSQGHVDPGAMSAYLMLDTFKSYV